MGMGKLLQIWRSPGFRRAVFAFEFVRTFANSDDKVLSLEWTLDSDYLLIGSKDLAARLFCVRKLKGVLNKPFLFLGHRDSVVGCFFGVDKMTNKVNRAFIITRDGYIFCWGYSAKNIKLDDSENGHSEPPSPATPESDDEVMMENGGDVGTNLKNKKSMTVKVESQMKMEKMMKSICTEGTGSC